MSIRKYTGQSEDCEARGGRYNVDYTVIRYKSGEAVSVSQMLGPEALKAYRKALPAQAVGDDGENCGEPTDSDTGWRIGRNAGRWGMYTHQDLGYFGCAVDAPVRFRLPNSLTGDTSTPPDSKQLSAKFKGYEDAYSSPTGDLLIVVTKEKFEFYEQSGGVPRKLLLTLPAHPIVMMQWSTGTHVQDWTSQLDRLAKQKLPEVVIHVVPASQ